jgi:hypothetical protein
MMPERASRTWYIAKNALNSVPKFIVFSAERSPRRNCTLTSAAMKLTRMRKRVMFARPYMLPKTASWECVSVKGHQRGEEGRMGRERHIYEEGRRRGSGNGTRSGYRSGARTREDETHQ